MSFSFARLPGPVTDSRSLGSYTKIAAAQPISEQLRRWRPTGTKGTGTGTEDQNHRLFKVSH